MHLVLLALALVAGLASRPAADPREPLVGVWTGDSICTPVRPACRDETAAYHIALGDRADAISMTMNKVVDGKEQTMGTLIFEVDAGARTLRSDVNQNGLHIVWEFASSGSSMRGTAKQLPAGDVIRNITLKKRDVQ
jgi:hypothetical protein